MMIEFTMNNGRSERIAINHNKVSVIRPGRGVLYGEDGKPVMDKKITSTTWGSTPMLVDITIIELGSEEEVVHVKELYPEVLHRLSNVGESQ